MNTFFFVTATVAGLIEATGSPDFRERENATRALVYFHYAKGQVKQAAEKHKDFEVRCRCKKILAYWPPLGVEGYLSIGGKEGGVFCKFGYNGPTWFLSPVNGSWDHLRDLDWPGVQVYIWNSERETYVRRKNPIAGK